MTDGEKLDLILSEIQGMKADMKNMSSRIDNVESQIKQTERVLKNEIRKESALILDEVERVHEILDKHKENKTVHTA